ncbi:MAG: transcription-repair coupling factor [Firmicutes bacterium]|nr:transcription-repair coupling factor [Bacillota bacterium]
MSLHLLLDLWLKDRDFLSLYGALEGGGHFLVTGTDGSWRNFLKAALIDKTRRNALIVVPDLARGEKVLEDLQSFLPQQQVLLFPPRDFFYTGEILTQSREILEQRLSVLERLANAPAGGLVVVAPVASLLNRMVPFSTWQEQALALQVGREYDWEQLLKKLVSLGFERTGQIQGKGQYSVRGDIIDIYPYHSQDPLRFTFFDREIESIRTFDLETQRSLTSLDKIVLYPALEAVLTAESREIGLENLQKDLDKFTLNLKREKKSIAADRLRTRIDKHRQILESGGYVEGIEQYLPYFYPQPHSLLSYFEPAGSLVFFDEPERIEKAEASLLDELKGYYSSMLDQGDVLPFQAENYVELKQSLAACRSLPLLAFTLFSKKTAYISPRRIFNFTGKKMTTFHGQWELFQEELEAWGKAGYSVFVFSHNLERAEEMVKLLGEHKIEAAAGFPAGGEPVGGRISVLPSSLEEGFIIPGLKLALVTERDLIPRRRRKKAGLRSRRDKKSKLDSYRQLNIGDYVVHEHHGVGQYLGIRTLEIGDVHKDYLYIKYAGQDKLYLPVDQIDLIQKYVGGEGATPKLYSLGGGEWNRVKSRVKASVQQLARDLLNLYAARESVQGLKFSPDHQWQKEFETRFPFEETPDQLQAIKDVKADMEKPKPMDRLICGDVGYGKTEVALRAAFKAMMDGKQVAFLVPTTLLAQQHYNTVKERFEGFPFEIELLSRFRSQAEQKQVVQRLRKGLVDMVIATHRLLSKDIKFKDLGLLIIDEEHRFGVRHKEKIKMLKENVDVLTMTATPIPRTLQMALTGSRDLSIIETPPENRYPVQTYVVEYSDHLVREAILRELQRGGQVFFVYNRVQTIEKWLQKLEKLVPEARFVISHGQMPEAKLEKVMLDFMNKKYDVLIATTIIEAGLDIPNVNTLIVYDADTFGLAQLYQLRGRVGRSDRIAYSYLTYRRDKVITEEAAKRLQAIKEFTELGSGFKIALRDLEIRGAGNILGPEQHGFIAAVGFELYCRLLEQAVQTLKGQRQAVKGLPGDRREREDIKIELNVNAYLPASYVPNQQEKIEIYRRIATIEREEEIRDIADELKDRFGRLQSPVENLLAVAQLRLLAEECKVESIEQDKKQVMVKFSNEAVFDNNIFWQLAMKYRGQLTVQAGKGITLKVKNQPREKELLQLLNNILFDLASSNQQAEPKRA